MSDATPGDLAGMLAEHMPSRWRSLANDNEVLRCPACRRDFGNATRKARRGDDERALREYAAHLRDVFVDWLRDEAQVEAVENAGECVSRHHAGHIIAALVERTGVEG